jgi:hypothetical protein
MQIRVVSLVLAQFAILSHPVMADTEVDGFAKWWRQFQAAVAARDIKAVAQGVQFPLNWENGPIREIKSEAELAQRFDAFFTKEIKQKVASKMPERMPNGIYSITWKARGNEYSLYFKPAGSGGFILDGLSEGPP